MKQKDLRVSWKTALLSFFAPIIAVMAVRWAVIEPFVVPSGSMIPTLLIHDHIFANKLAYGLHLPFSNRWLWRWSKPQRGDIAVFRYPKNPDVFFVKRIVGLPGDEIALNHGVLTINGQSLALQALPHSGDDHYDYYQEGKHQVRFIDKEISFYPPTKVPAGQFFAMGDNRDESSDSRYWGFVPQDNFIGSVVLVWLSCAETLPSATFLCDPQTIRWQRFFSSVQ